MSSREEALGNLKLLIREAALSCLKEYGRIPDVTVSEIEGTFPIHGQWMSLVLVSGDFLRITFKAHFFTKAGTHFTQTSTRKKTGAIQMQQVLDFSKEYCNQVAGKIKWEIENLGQEVGLSLPVSLRGFDEIYFPIPDNKTLFGDRWKLVSPAASLVASVLIEVTDFAALSQFDFKGRAQRKQGEMELL